PPPRAARVPYTTLFRSSPTCATRCPDDSTLSTARRSVATGRRTVLCVIDHLSGWRWSVPAAIWSRCPEASHRMAVAVSNGDHARSEEHTSELQSRENLV